MLVNSTPNDNGGLTKWMTKENVLPMAALMTYPLFSFSADVMHVCMQRLTQGFESFICEDYLQWFNKYFNNYFHIIVDV